MGNSFADAMEPEKFGGSNFKCWSTKLVLWLTAICLSWVVKPVVFPLTAEKQAECDKANVMAVGCILSVLSDKLCDVYMHMKNARELMEAIDHKFGASDARHELYVTERYHDYKMVDNHGVIEQAHEIQVIVGELQQLGRNLPDQFVAGALLPSYLHLGGISLQL